jgi:hypothetical protein
MFVFVLSISFGGLRFAQVVFHTRPYEARDFDNFGALLLWAGECPTQQLFEAIWKLIFIYNHSSHFPIFLSLSPLTPPK